MTTKFNLTAHDQALVSEIQLTIESQGGARPIDGFPDGGGGQGGGAERGLFEASQQLSAAGRGTGGIIGAALSSAGQGFRQQAAGAGGNTIKFQFPARLKSDQKDARWMTMYDAPTYEPGYLFKGGGPRRIQLHTVYLVGGPPAGWTTLAVANEIKRIKSYFYVGGPTHDFLPVFKLKLYNHVPVAGDRAAWRGVSAAVTPSEELIKDAAGVYALKTEVILSLEMATNITQHSGEAKYPFTNIPPKTLHQWY